MSWQRPSQRTSVTETFGYHMSWLLSAQPVTIRPAIRQISWCWDVKPEHRQILCTDHRRKNDGNYDRFVKQMRERLVTAYTKVRQHMQRSAEKNKRYYDLGLRPKNWR